MTVKNQTLLLLLLLLWAVRVPSTFAASPGTQTHNTRGLVRELSPDHTKAVIRHEPIPDYMPAMTMEFNVKDTNELAGITVGDTVTFQLTANAETHWISQIRRVGKPSTPIPALVTAPPATNLPPSVHLVTELKPGDLMPDFTVTDETGKQIQLSYYRGKAVALTFFFTRCPLPDFCPRMATNFAKARHLLLVAPDSRRNWQFLSVSFDPDFDNPPILASYANLYRDGNPDRWIFAVASTPHPGTAGSATRPYHDKGGGREHLPQPPNGRHQSPGPDRPPVRRQHMVPGRSGNSPSRSREARKPMTSAPCRINAIPAGQGPGISLWRAARSTRVRPISGPPSPSNQQNPSGARAPARSTQGRK